MVLTTSPSVRCSQVGSLIANQYTLFVSQTVRGSEPCLIFRKAGEETKLRLQQERCWVLLRRFVDCSGSDVIPVVIQKLESRSPFRSKESEASICPPESNRR